MILPFVYWMLMMSSLIVFFGFYIKKVDDTGFGIHIIAIGSLLLMVTGFDILRFGIERLINLSTTALGSVLIGVGFILIITQYMEIYQEAF